MTLLLNDIKYALRMFTKNPGFTMLAVLTLGLGIGAASTLFGVFDSLVLNPFPYPNSNRIAYIWSSTFAGGGTQPLSIPDFRDIREQNKSFAEIGVYTLGRFNLGLDNPVQVFAARCTAGVLKTFGMQPAMGRLFEESDEAPGAAPVTIISHSFWTRVLGGDPKILGRTIRLDGRETTVVGIMPANFEFQCPWYFYMGYDYELWVPLVPGSSGFNGGYDGRGSHWLVGIGRLRDGVTLEAADADIRTIGARLAKAYPDSNLHKPFVVISLWRQITKTTASGTLLLFGATIILLLVACANVASLLLARGTQRQGEFGVRLALGGARSDVIRLLLCESLLLALLGSFVGIILANWGFAMMKHVIPPLLAIGARREALRLNGPVLTFSIGLAALTAILFGLLPALLAARTPVVETLKSDGRSQTGSRLRHRFLRYLVAGQIAVAVVLGNGAILLFSSYLNVIKDNRDLNTDQVVAADIALRGDRYREINAQRSFWQDLFERIHALPGVVAVATTTKAPLEGGSNGGILVDDEVYDPAIERPNAEFSYISPEYFPAMGIPLLRGRSPGTEDARGEVYGVAVNQTLVNRYWPDIDPIGRQIRGNSAKPYFRAIVVGVVADVRQHGADQTVLPEIYFPRERNSAWDSAILVVRTSGDAHAQIPLLQSAVAAIDSDLPLANVRTMKEVVSKKTGPRRFLTQLVSLFMITTLALAMVGIYGTLSYTVSQRQREIGVRMALGATYNDILKFVFRQAALWVLAGLAIGLLLTMAASLLLRSAVYGVNPLDPLYLLLSLVAVGIAAIVACILPACRATRINPMEAMRCE